MADDLPGRRCASIDIGTGNRARMARLEADFVARSRILEADLALVVAVHFVHFTDGATGAITDQQRADQIDVLNTAYAPMNISFSNGSVTHVDDARAFGMGHMSLAEREAKTTHQAIPPQLGLNFYTARPGEGLLGWATFPFQMSGDPSMDGVVMLDTTLPGGSGAPFNLGMTAVHEVGHWLGLYHTFQDGCSGAGDEVTDTPAHAGPNYGKPSDAGQPHNLCSAAPAGSLCPIHNYMNYVDDDWMFEFTSGQRERVWAQIAMFRRDLLTAGAGMDSNEADLLPQVVW